MRISVVGCGYLGVAHAASLARLGHDVVGIDVDADKVAVLARGDSPVFEPSLSDAVRSSVASGRLRFSTQFVDARGAVVHFLCVGTPQLAGRDASDLRDLDAAIDSLIPHLGAGDLVVGKSTVPPGTAARLARKIAAHTAALLAWNPEFLREGFAMHDSITPDRLVYGIPAGQAGVRARALLDQVYARSLANATPVVVTDYATAELIKLSANAFLATKISFINATAQIAEFVGADIGQVADAIGLDDRIGRRFLDAGAGFGGGCLPKDLRSLIARADDLGLAEARSFFVQVDAVNRRQRARMVELVIDALGGCLPRKKIAVLGLAFKPDSDDIRDSPALDVAMRLMAGGADVVATDPAAIENARRAHPRLRCVADPHDALAGADLVAVATEWSQFRELDPAEVAGWTTGRVVIDGRNCLDAHAWTAAGWIYRGLGLGAPAENSPGPSDLPRIRRMDDRCTGREMTWTTAQLQEPACWR